MGLILAGLVGYAGWAVLAIFSTPDVRAVATTAADGRTSQQKLYDLATGRRRGPPSGVVLTDGELNALLDRHVAELGGVPLAAMTIRTSSDGLVDIATRLPLRVLARETPLVAMIEMLPAAWAERPMWLHLRVRPRVEGSERRHYLRLDVERFDLGTQRLPALTVRLLLDPATLALLRWPLPSGITTVTVEAGHVVLHARAP